MATSRDNTSLSQETKTSPAVWGWTMCKEQVIYNVSWVCFVSDVESIRTTLRTSGALACDALKGRGTAGQYYHLNHTNCSSTTTIDVKAVVNAFLGYMIKRREKSADLVFDHI